MIFRNNWSFLYCIKRVSENTHRIERVYSYIGLKSRLDEVASSYATGAQLHFASLVFHFFLPLLVSFVSRLGLVRLGSAMLGPRTVLPFSPSLSFPLAVSLSQGLSPLQPLAGITGPHSYQPLVFTSDQVGGDLDKTTNKLRYPPSASLSAQGADTSVR